MFVLLVVSLVAKVSTNLLLVTKSWYNCLRLLRLSHDVSILSKEIRDLKSIRPTGDQSSNDPTAPVVFSSAEIRTILYEEAVEIKEREKRVESVIIRGLGSDDSVSRKFSEVVSYLFSHNKVIQLDELVPINQNLVRAKIKDSAIRKELLSVTKNL